MASDPSRNTPPPKTILILAANPKNTDRLRLGEEVRQIQESLKRSCDRVQFQVMTAWAVRPDDLRRALLEHEPQIVHFSGHGAGDPGLVLEDDCGQAHPVTAEALSALFQAFAHCIECVLLNACYSEVQANAIVQHIPYAIGMDRAIGDRAAIQFAIGFYDGLGHGRSIETAFNLGLSALQLHGAPQSARPAIKHRSQFAARIFLSYRSQSPDLDLAQSVYQALTAAGHQVFMAGENIRLGENWPHRINCELERCDYFLLLLSKHAATSEMVTEEVRRAKELRENRSPPRPILLPIRVNFPLDSPLNYDLRGDLSSIQQRHWQSPADTDAIVEEILQLLATGTTPDPVSLPETAFPAIDSPDRPPLPVAEPELQREPGGSVPLQSSLYVERPPIETDCYIEILQPGALIRIKAPRQMGKTSLMARILHQAREQGYHAIPLSFQRAENALFADLDRFLYWFCQQVGRRLKRLQQLDDCWQGYGSKDKCAVYFEECLLETLDRPLVLALDEVDRVFPFREIADEFFALLRSWYEAARYGDLSSELWEKLRLVVVHSTEVYVPLNINQSPFNVGKNVELPEFTPAQVADLAQRYGLGTSPHRLESLMSLVGGHPYLIRKALYHLRRQDLTLAELVQSAPTEAGIYSDHLQRHLWNLRQYPPLALALQRVLQQNSPVLLDAESAFKLDSMGLVKLQGNATIPRCDLYRHYFRVRLD